jgi:hypothetical protein
MLVFARHGSDAFQGLAQAIGILMNVLKRDGFGTDMPPTQWVVLIATDINHFAPLGFDHQATHGLTQMTYAVVNLN